jgi:hypothetical protein
VVNEVSSADNTDPHFSTFDLPFVSVAFVASPFGLEIVKDAGKRVVLAIQWRWRWDSCAWLALLERLGLLLLLLALLLLVIGL